MSEETRNGGHLEVLRVECWTGSVGRLAVLADLQPAPQQGTQQRPTLTGLPIYSSDGMKVGEVVGIKTGLDGRPQLIKAEIGSLLGLGTNTVLITPDEIEQRADGLRLRMPAEQIRAVLQAQR